MISFGTGGTFSFPASSFLIGLATGAATAGCGASSTTLVASDTGSAFGDLAASSCFLTSSVY
jgi:hypothetical protein